MPLQEVGLLRLAFDDFLERVRDSLLVGARLRARHVEQAERKGLTHVVVNVASLDLDIDTGDDLAELPAALEGAHGRAPRTRGALRQIDRARHA